MKPLHRTIISILLAIHLAALFLGPFAFATQAGPGVESPVARLGMSILRPYVDITFLNHGYFFFAPNPGPCCIVRYKVEFDDGRPAVEGVFPDRNVHRPRLLYHRHFMLSEQWNAAYVPSDPPPEIAAVPARDRDWRRQRQLYQLQKRSFEQHLAAVHGGGRVTITRVEHRPAEMRELFEEGRGLTDPVSYRDLPEEGPARVGP